MAWVCPVCGADDNQEDSVKCSCGFALDDTIHNEKRRRTGFAAPFSYLYLAIFILATLCYIMSFTDYSSGVLVAILTICALLTIPPMLILKWMINDINGYYTGDKRFLTVRYSVLAFVITLQIIDLFYLYDYNKTAVISGVAMLFSLWTFDSLFFGRKRWTMWLKLA